mmetsp:Transcript_6611/g.22061  ORF Transcript_6611/g.22061 Transcript_6611/m.22061 type:complete len:215 (+) Transcript_6611:219-863(+)
MKSLGSVNPSISLSKPSISPTLWPNATTSVCFAHATEEARWSPISAAFSARKAPSRYAVAVVVVVVDDDEEEEDALFSSSLFVVVLFTDAAFDHGTLVMVLFMTSSFVKSAWSPPFFNTESHKVFLKSCDALAMPLLNPSGQLSGDCRRHSVAFLYNFCELEIFLNSFAKCALESNFFTSTMQSPSGHGRYSYTFAVPKYTGIDPLANAIHKSA